MAGIDFRLLRNELEEEDRRSYFEGPCDLNDVSLGVIRVWKPLFFRPGL
jgi:hypothetical protein